MVLASPPLRILCLSACAPACGPTVAYLGVVKVNPGPLHFVVAKGGVVAGANAGTVVNDRADKVVVHWLVGVARKVHVDVGADVKVAHRKVDKGVDLNDPRRSMGGRSMRDEE